MIASHKKLTSILELFLKDKEELSLSEMSKLTGLNKSTINRISSFLVDENYLKQQEKRGKYSLGMKFLDFSAAIKSRIKIRDIALRSMDKLMHTVKESCALILWDGQKAFLIDSVEYDSVLQASPSEKSKLALHATTGGKIILANMDDKSIDKYIDEGMIEKFTEHTITDADELKKHLMLIREQGFAIEIEEHVIGVSSVAAGIRDRERKVIGAIAVIGPTARLTYQRLMAVTPEVKKCAQEISTYLGWKGD
jgi:IclR family transcriptional regulator, KDG regulon repressor